MLQVSTHSTGATVPFTKDRIVHTRWLFFINWERITQIIWHHMEFFLHIMYFLCRRCERRGLQGVLFRRRGEKKSCMYGEEGGGVGGGSRGLVGRSKHAQRKYASCTRWTWGLRGLLSRLQERPVRRGAGERNHAAAVHTQQGFHYSVFCCFYFEKCFIFPQTPKHI